MDKTEEAENVASSINVPPGYHQTFISAPVVAVRSTHGGQCSAQVSDLKPSERTTMSTEVAKRCIGIDKTKTVLDAGSE